MKTTMKRVVLGYLLFLAIEAFATFLFLVFGAASGGQIEQFVFDWVLVVVFLTFIGLGAIFGLMLWRFVVVEKILQSLFSSPLRVSRLLWLSGGGSVLFFTILLIPSYCFGSWASFIVRLFPLIWLGSLGSIQTFLVTRFLVRRSSENLSREVLPKTRLFSIATFIVLMLILVWIDQTKTGIVAYAHTPWYPVGVPLLPGQVWFMGWLTVAFGAAWMLWKRLRSMNQEKHSKWNRDILVGLGIWVIAAIMWVSASLPRNFFFPGPYPPNNVIYPYADSAIWDMGGQYALIGQGFDNSDPFQDHVGLMGLLAFLHILVGNDYARISAALAGLLAIFPALMYWLGKSIHSRWAGFFIAGLTIFHEMNAFAASSMTDLSHARFLLTEYPTRVGLATLALLLFFWFRAPRRNIAYALPVGGLLAFMILLRFSMLAFPFAVLVGALLVFGRDWKGWLRASLLIGVSVLLALAPWMWRSWNLSGTPFFFAEKTQKLFQEEFRFWPSVVPTPSSSLFNFEKDSPTVAGLNQSVNPANTTVRYSLSLPMTGSAAPKVPSLIVGHFMHNLVTSVLILPTSLVFDDVEHTIYEVHPYWEKKGSIWDGDLSLQETLLLIINLALISIGLGVSWDKWKLVGLIPLGICLAYNLSLAVARTSGGRYIVPMDWGVLFYWGIGLVQVILFLWPHLDKNIQEQDSIPTVGVFSYKRGWLSFLPFLVFVGAMTLVDRSVPSQYPALDKTEMFERIKQSGVLEQADIPERKLAVFLGMRNSRAYWGQALYPRFYGMGQGEHSGGVDAYDPAEYPRLAFTLIGAFDKKDIVLPWVIQDLPKLRNVYFPNASETIVVGCARVPRSAKTRSVIDALFVVILGERPQIYIRNPSAPLKCPVPEPVCEDSYNCR